MKINMEKTRFYQLTQSELILLVHAIKLSSENSLNNKENLIELITEIEQQIYINDWSKKEIEIKNEIEKTENQIQELKKKLEDYKKLLNN
jgi:hypothetical protein